MRLQKTVGGAMTAAPAPKAMIPNLTTAANLLSAPAMPIGAEVVDFRGYFKVEIFPHNAVVYRPGESCDRVCLLKRGRVRLLRTGRNATRSVLAILRAGDLFGELALGDMVASEELAVASGEAEVWSIEGSEFKNLLESRPSLSLDIIRSQNDRIRDMRRRLLGLTFKEVPARLAETLLTLGETLGERCPHGGELDLRGVTQQDLADLVGASRSFVSTLINEMKRDGYLGNVGRVLCIRDQKSLRKIASKEK
jgi:CRP-like cAMP-binding protein